MAKGNNTRSTPKRGAFPTPRNVLGSATPYEPEKPDQSGLAAYQPNSGADSPEEPDISGTETGGIAMSDKAGSATGVPRAGYMGTPGTPPPPSGSSGASSQHGVGNMRTPGTPPSK